MCSGLAQHLNALNELEADKYISNVEANHEAHQSLPPMFLPQEIDSITIDEENDIVPELMGRLDCVGAALNILSGNPRPHDAKQKRARSTSSASRLAVCQSSSAPILQRHVRFKTSARWNVGSSCSGQNHHSSQHFRLASSKSVKSRLDSMGLRGTSKRPIRSMLVRPSSNQGFKNASWDLQSASFPIDEDSDFVPELMGRLDCVDSALDIFSCNPRPHDAKQKRSRSTSSASRLPVCQSSSAPILQKHVRFKTSARWDVGSSCSGQNDHSSQDVRLAPSKSVKSRLDNMGLSGTSKKPSRSMLVRPSSNQGFKNASWDKPSSQLQGPTNNRLRNLGLTGINAKKKHEVKEKYIALMSSVVPDISRPCRWTSIPKHSSDSNLVYPKRHLES